MPARKPKNAKPTEVPSTVEQDAAPVNADRWSVEEYNEATDSPPEDHHQDDEDPEDDPEVAS